MSTVFNRMSCRNFWNTTLIFCSTSSKISSFFYKPPLPFSREDEKKSQSVMSSQSFLLAILLCLADYAISLEMYCPPTAVAVHQTEVIPNLAWKLRSACSPTARQLTTLWELYLWGKEINVVGYVEIQGYHLKLREIKCYTLEIVSLPSPSLFWYL